MTIDDINIIREMNTAQRNIDLDTGEERDARSITSNRGTTCNQIQQKKLQICYCTNRQTIQYHNTTCSYNDDANEHKRGNKKIWG